MYFLFTVNLSHNCGNATSAGWQATLCDPIWYESTRSGEAGKRLYPSSLYSIFLTEGLSTPMCAIKLHRHATKLSECLCTPARATKSPANSLVWMDHVPF